MLRIETQNGFFGQLLKWARDRRALYLHAQVDRPFRIRIGGKLEPVPEEVFPVLNFEEMMAGLEEFFDSATLEKIRAQQEYYFQFEYAGNR